MKYRRFGKKYVVRIDKGEEITAELEKLARKENIKLAEVSALGAVGDFTVGTLLTGCKTYRSHDFGGDFEIVSLWGTVSTMNGEYYPHIHMSAANTEGAVFGGHLNRAVVSATCEMTIGLIDGEVDRFRDEETGLNLFDLP